MFKILISYISWLSVFFYYSILHLKPNIHFVLSLLLDYWRHQRANQKPYIYGQTIQWPKEIKIFEDNKWLSKAVNLWTDNSMTTGKKILEDNKWLSKAVNVWTENSMTKRKKIFEDNKWLSKAVNLWTDNSMTTGKKCLKTTNGYQKP